MKHCSWLVIVVIILVGACMFGYRYYQDQRISESINYATRPPTIDENNDSEPTVSAGQIDELTKQNAKNSQWQNAKITSNVMADDLIQVCVDENNESMDHCDWFEYWTNNRSDRWELIGRYSAGAEGLGSCEDWEKLKVAKGMECMRWGERGWSESVVNY